MYATPARSQLASAPARISPSNKIYPALPDFSASASSSAALVQTGTQKPTDPAVITSQPSNQSSKEVLSKPNSITAARPASEPSITPLIKPEAVRVANVRIAFKNLRWNGVFLAALWWTSSSKPYKWILYNLRLQHYSKTLLTLTYLNLALHVLFLFNLFYSAYAFFFPSSQAPRAPSSQSAASLPVEFTHIMTPPSKSSPVTRRSQPATPISNKKVSTPTRIKQDSNTQQSPRVSGGSPLQALKASILSQQQTNSPKLMNREEMLKEQAFISRHSPSRFSSRDTRA